MNRDSSTSRITRRRALQTASALTVTAAWGVGRQSPLNAGETPEQTAGQPSRGSIQQSIVSWCFSARGKQWSIAEICRVAREIGYTSVELVDPEHFATLKQYGLTCALVPANIQPGPPFMRGFNNPRFHPMVIQATREAIDAAADHGYPNVIAFTGFSAKDPDDPSSDHLSLEEGATHCVRAFKEVIGLAERRGVNLCLEMLSTRDDSDPMKGHPGYQGNHLDYCLDIIKRVGSPRMKLLFDIYHVQVMDGDLIRRLQQCREFIGHVHTAGNPGRGELDDNQEINYQAVMRALLDIGYQGFVGQEFIPTRDPYEGLQQAFQLCDV